MHSKFIVFAAALSLGVVSIAWSADEPASPAATPAAQPAAQTAASSTSTDAAAKAPAKAAPASAKATEVDENEKHLLARGYKKETHNGQTVFCRKEIKTGSHFETKQCGTAESMALAEQQARDLMQNSQNQGGSRIN